MYNQIEKMSTDRQTDKVHSVVNNNSVKLYSLPPTLSSQVADFIHGKATLTIICPDPAALAKTQISDAQKLKKPVSS